MTQSPCDVIAGALVKVPTESEFVTLSLFGGNLANRRLIAEHVFAALAAAGYSVVPTAEYEDLRGRSTGEPEVRARLAAYAIGIANPVIERDPTGRARGGIIKGGQIVELSLVDRHATEVRRG